MIFSISREYSTLKQSQRSQVTGSPAERARSSSVVAETKNWTFDIFWNPLKDEL